MNAMKHSLCRAGALAALALSATGCPSYDPLWSQQSTVIPVVGSLQETLSVSSLSVPAGGSAQLTVTVTPAGGFTGLIQFAPINSQAGVTLSPTSIDIEGTAPVQVPMTLSASADAVASTQTVTLAAAANNQAAQAVLSLTVTN